MRIPSEETSELHSASKLLHAVLMLNDGLEHSMCRHLKINETDFQALQHLILNESMTPSGLAGRLHISTAATTAVIDRMSERGHVLRRPHPSDRRSILRYPSPAAVAETIGALRPLFTDAERSINRLDPDQQQAVVTYLENILDAMQTHLETLQLSPIKKRNERS